MTISDKLEELYINTLMQLSELQSFKFSTLRGYDLIETQYAEHMEEIEKQISNSKEKPAHIFPEKDCIGSCSLSKRDSTFRL